jgi:hypothetical protein
VKLSKWHPIALLGSLAIMALMLGMQMALCLMFLAGFHVGLENAPADAGWSGSVMFMLITLGGLVLPFWLPLSFARKAFDWWDRVCGVRARVSEGR